jgi:hypothetical protein
MLRRKSLEWILMYAKSVFERILKPFSERGYPKPAGVVLSGLDFVKGLLKGGGLKKSIGVCSRRPGGTLRRNHKFGVGK